MNSTITQQDPMHNTVRVRRPLPCSSLSVVETTCQN